MTRELVSAMQTIKSFLFSQKVYSSTLWSLYIALLCVYRLKLKRVKKEKCSFTRGRSIISQRAVRLIKYIKIYMATHKVHLTWLAAYRGALSRARRRRRRRRQVFEILTLVAHIDYFSDDAYIYNEWNTVYILDIYNANDKKKRNCTLLGNVAINRKK